MSPSDAARPARLAPRPTRAWTLALLGAGLAGVLGCQPSGPSASPGGSAAAAHLQPPRAEGRTLGRDDGVVPGGTTVDADEPAVTGLDPALLAALRRAATDAARDGVEVSVDSDWRSRAYQEQLLRQGIARYGSREEAARWVATPDASAHVSGDAVDLGGAGARAWLSRHGARYGLCQTYRNEPWHYELRPRAAEDGCPGPFADASHDPRLQ